MQTPPTFVHTSAMRFEKKVRNERRTYSDLHSLVKRLTYPLTLTPDEMVKDALVKIFSVDKRNLLFLLGKFLTLINVAKFLASVPKNNALQEIMGHPSLNDAISFCQNFGRFFDLLSRCLTTAERKSIKNCQKMQSHEQFLFGDLMCEPMCDLTCEPMCEPMREPMLMALPALVKLHEHSFIDSVQLTADSASCKIPFAIAHVVPVPETKCMIVDKDGNEWVPSLKIPSRPNRIAYHQELSRIINSSSSNKLAEGQEAHKSYKKAEELNPDPVF